MHIQYILGGLVLLLALWTLGSYLVVRTIEKPAYTVLERKDGYEVREYASYIVAETKVQGERQEAVTKGFQIIADYIFGNNVTKKSIAMTAPVLETKISESIAMTAPVLSTENMTGERTIAFVLPSAYTLDTLPVPNNSAVTLREVPAHTVAVLQFTWYATPTRIEKKKEALIALLKKEVVTITGDILVAQYNPPLSMPLLLRNEIIIPIAYSTKTDSAGSAIENATTQENQVVIKKTALFANGCFWCVEHDLEEVRGVIDVVSGYADGEIENPTYENYGENGFREVVLVTYDENVVTYGKLVEHILKHGNPTDPDGSFGDRGKQYAPAIYFESEEEKNEAQRVIADLNALRIFSATLNIPVIPRTKFWPAEEYHQDYAEKNPIRYTYYRNGSGRDEFIEKHWNIE